MESQHSYHIQTRNPHLLTERRQLKKTNKPTTNKAKPEFQRADVAQEEAKPSYFVRHFSNPHHSSLLKPSVLGVECVYTVSKKTKRKQSLASETSKLLFTC